MSYIETIDPERAEGEVREMYQRQQAHFGYLPNYARVFCHRPEVMNRWAALIAAIRRPMDARRYELATLAAARALGNTYCSLAHAKALSELLGMDETQAMVAGGAGPLDEAERSMMAFAAKVACRAQEVGAEDIDALRAHGFGDDEIFDIVAVVAGRAFFTRILDGLGTEADAAFRELPPGLVAPLSVGRPIAST
ncbi:peroxidase-related enzyme [Halomonas sp. MCCC 1A17488]|uniref:Peroxidase-related enzyme n=1 Tax=Billgrantia sulfidoxydans TaxID=2733484 RepID=A0ABX7W367_9GAMM|nr:MULTISPECIES: peroxidase-related enzyme [Halomonas]MCE8015473.1 peroxidase-related enzyme [Halomonas sp. MCCC 1A17488]MCG3238806.1 peroxidase-related enzyme [Halomonas sp. MCCC 1A17488]QPP51232.1 peroxidase-related enzyme [Halomonas sp. SS10-MC5]QTP54789.1 peroxidase-related enzyme [Halomonas sulfidoxydans]